jgi:hypothetical protein
MGSSNGSSSASSETPADADARRSRRRGAIATGAAVLALGGAIAAVIIKAASDGLRARRR